MTETASRGAGWERKPGLWDWLFRPFVYVAGGRALALGVAAILLAGLIASVGTVHFDGVLDVHIGLRSAWWVFPAEGIVNWLALAVVLLVVGRLASPSAFRAIDLVGTQALARSPSLIIAAAGAAPPVREFALSLAADLSRLPRVSAADAVVIALVALVWLAAWLWMIALMYHSYSLCCNLRGVKAAVTFVAGLLVAEVISKAAVLRIIAL